MALPTGKALGQAIIVTNKPGAASNIGAAPWLAPNRKATPCRHADMANQHAGRQSSHRLQANLHRRKRLCPSRSCWCAFAYCWWSTASSPSRATTNFKPGARMLFHCRPAQAAPPLGDRAAAHALRVELRARALPQCSTGRSGRAARQIPFMFVDTA